MFMSCTKHEIRQSQSRAVTEKKCTKSVKHVQVVLLNIKPIAFFAVLSDVAVVVI